MDTDIVSFTFDSADEEMRKNLWTFLTKECNDSSSPILVGRGSTVAKKTRKGKKKKAYSESESSSSKDSSSSEEETESESSSSNDSSSSEEEQSCTKRLSKKRKKKTRAGKERQSSSSKGSSTPDEREYTASESFFSFKEPSASVGGNLAKKQCLNFFSFKEPSASEGEDLAKKQFLNFFSLKEPSASEGEDLAKKQFMNIQSRGRKEKIYTRAGNGKQSKKFQKRESHINQYQKTFDDTLTQSTVEGLSINMKSVGVLVSCGNPIGTVFSVGEKYVMTAYHVIKRIPENCLFGNRETFANFGESPYTQADVTFTFRRIAFFDEKLDCLVLEVSETIRLPRRLKLSKFNCSELGATKLSIIGYGHPDQPKKTLDPCCPLIDSSRIVKAQQWLDENKLYHKSLLKGMRLDQGLADFGFGNLKDSSKFIIDSYMEQGVSGAPALAACGITGLTEVSGLVTHGIPEIFYLLPKLVTLAMFPREHRFASGTTTKAIYESIRKKDRRLAHALFD